ncbi:aldehyde dehydrogenase [Mycobacterium deserti]|uniref:Putative succinate-semialdehyde dehydrogenase [NADP(+)] 2 n=1 Tax=Mycobacterium deserti TaxID=2978347 RepID=A0ABT2MEP2_9MYCO|nr:aldehyde dehydrogenase [Mycobacterium deserti]MCT7660712.1 aldehyde dehydrogenase [Mycobacterium deserti]
MSPLTYPMVIGNHRPPVNPDRALEVRSPLSGDLLGLVSDATPAEVHDAVSAAQHGFDETWRYATGSQRAQLMHRLADLIDMHADELGGLETADNGKLLRETTMQARFAARNYRFFAGIADKLTGRTIPMDNLSTFDYTLREPVGVAALITAWNSPMQLLANKLAPALAAGNCVVVKPSELAPRSTIRLAELIEEAGFPPGVFNVITGGHQAGAALTADARLGLISFTGSVATGQAIAATAAKNLVPVTLELGGKSPNIIFDDANLDRAVIGAVAGIFAASGQTCIAGSRLLVQSNVYDEVVEHVTERARTIRVGDPALDTTQMGPAANMAQHKRILSMIEVGLSSGAKLACGGGAVRDPELPDGLFIEPTVFVDVDPASRIAQEEIFGPVLSIIRFDTEADAISIANGTEFGLAAGIWTESLSRAHRVARELLAGMVWVNTYRSSAAQAPFGGVKKSGYGRERGLEAIDPYLRTKNVMVDLSDSVRDPFSIQT